MDAVDEAERIKTRLRACKTPQEVNDVANEERENFRRLQGGGGFGPVLAIQIKNLKAYMIRIKLRY